MKKNLSWISVTSIIPHPDTNNLLTSFTNQFLSPNKKCLEFYQFKFDFERQCIIFIVAINDQIEQLIGKLNNFFNTYHNRKDSLYFLENIELPHLNTTFQFKEAANAGFKRYLQFQQELSMLLENVFKEDSFQEESVPTLAYYLQLILINVVVGSFPSYRDELLKLSQIESKKFLLYENKIRVEIIKNKDLLIEIADDIFLGKDLAKSISWFAQWTLACSHQFKNIKVSKKYTVNDVKNLLEDLLLLIDHQLWLRKENSTVLRATIEFSISHLFFDQRFEKMLSKVVKIS